MKKKEVETFIIHRCHFRRKTLLSPSTMTTNTKTTTMSRALKRPTDSAENCMIRMFANGNVSTLYSMEEVLLFCIVTSPFATPTNCYAKMKHRHVMPSPQHLSDEMPQTNWLLFVLLLLLLSQPSPSPPPLGIHVRFFLRFAFHSSPPYSSTWCRFLFNVLQFIGRSSVMRSHCQYNYDVNKQCARHSHLHTNRADNDCDARSSTIAIH